ncbi:GNAT family N-acetyltransferase [Pseudomonas tremae]|uniref:Acetyltransferase n=2 Tax=Pseudomonas syringae group TaxID=136849 RepID=A0AB37QSA2_9PSED|nr:MULTISPECIES: GNAT family N-acetyltransferase [Pseudomonas syringae group]KGS15733.1 GNAT family acetyltransferase [Pseudomonas coronafaciens]MCQ3024686.1 GNAT family N-acetyltransferase [Pseudomonas tremae]RMR99387.1 Acetyltransferase [Pseudomonas coronafaciens pv. garcae]RMS01840.1 Acetyltransferase [Pseudomonas coronafaciens pv. garcae]RMV06441.1 Acetyltransferase [Pseudomonas coronafaciens pv. coronafaciens]
MLAQQRLDFEYRPMTAADVGNAHELSIALKWPHRLEDWAMLQRVAQGVVALHNGRLIGSAFACHQGKFSTIGLVIVSDDYQGKGIGRKLMEMAVGSVPPRTAVLNATLAGAPLYEKMGFVSFGEVHQRQGQAQQPTPTGLNAGEDCRALSEADHPRVLELANAGSGMDRSVTLGDLLNDIEHAVGIERDGQLQAFALLRPFGRGLCIGPVVAQTADQARHMIGQLLTKVPYAFVRIDIPAECGLDDWLEEAGLKRVDSVTCMSMGAVPQPSQGVRQFALITQAIG